jgi:ketosteroid isomerase-like protein
VNHPELVAYARSTLALPLEQQRDILLPAYRAAYAAYGVDWDLNTAVMADDHVFIAGGSSRLPGLPERTVGREAYLDAQRQLLEAVDVARIELDDVIPLGDGRVATMTRFVIRTGGGEVEQQCMGLHEYRDGEIVRQTYWFDRDEGRAAIGL